MEKNTLLRCNLWRRVRVLHAHQEKQRQQRSQQRLRRQRQPQAQPQQRSQQRLRRQQQPQAQQEDPYEKLAKMKKLLDDGVITQEEFDKAKAQLLGL